METLKEMKERHKKEIDELQSACPHENSSHMPYYWAPAHFSHYVIACDDCGMILVHLPNVPITAGTTTQSNITYVVK